jgi:hypothetical protein
VDLCVHPVGMPRTSADWKILVLAAGRVPIWTCSLLFDNICDQWIANGGVCVCVWCACVLVCVCLLGVTVVSVAIQRGHARNFPAHHRISWPRERVQAADGAGESMFELSACDVAWRDD